MDVPLPVPAVKGYDPIFIRPPLDSLKKELVPTSDCCLGHPDVSCPLQSLATSPLSSLPGYCLKKPLALPKYCHISEGSRSKLSTKTLFKASDQYTPLTMAESEERQHKLMNERSLLSLKQKVLQQRTQKHQQRPLDFIFFSWYEKIEHEYFARSSSVLTTITAEHLHQPLLFRRWSRLKHKAQIITSALRNSSALLGNRVENTQAEENTTPQHTSKLWRGRGIRPRLKTNQKS